MFSLICARINCWVNNLEAGDSRRHRAYYDVIVMVLICIPMRPSVWWRSLTAEITWMRKVHLEIKRIRGIQHVVKCLNKGSLLPKSPFNGQNAWTWVILFVEVTVYLWRDCFIHSCFVISLFPLNFKELILNRLDPYCNVAKIFYKFLVPNCTISKEYRETYSPYHYFMT